MQAVDLIDTISQLAVLKGFPRTDGNALLVVAEALLRMIQPRRDPPADAVLLDRAQRIVTHVIETAPEWRGPAQFESAQISLAEAAQRWDIPGDWRPEEVRCKGCADTGAVQLEDGMFGICLCGAGEDLGALDHVARLNAVVAEARERRARMRRAS